MPGKRKRALPPVPLFHDSYPAEKMRLAWFVALEAERKRQAGLDKLVDKLEEDVREVMALLREAPVQGAVSSCGDCGQLDKKTGEEGPGDEEPEEDSVLDLTSESYPEEVVVLDLTADRCLEEVADEHSRPRGRRNA